MIVVLSAKQVLDQGEKLLQVGREFEFIEEQRKALRKMKRNRK